MYSANRTTNEVKNLKKTAIIFICISALLLLPACDGQGNENEVLENPDSGYETEQPPESSAVQGEEVTQGTGTTDLEESSETTHFATDAFALEVNGFLIEMDQDINYVLAALGEPNYQMAVPSCAFDGEDRILRYDNLSIQIHTYPMGDNDFIQTLSLRDDNIRTSEGGIRLGATYEDVVAAYGSDYEKDFNMYKFTRGRTTLEFYILDGIVLGITFGLIFET